MKKTKQGSVRYGAYVTPEEIRRYRRVSTARKLAWLDEMRRLMFAAMTPALMRRFERLRRMGY